jgi:hypothetical protein
MREILLVSISALLGYILLSAFSTSSVLDGSGVPRVLEKFQLDPEAQQELALNRANNDKEKKFYELDTEVKKEQLKSDEHITINKQENETEVQIKNIEAGTAVRKIQSDIEKTKQTNYTYVVFAFLFFLLVIVYLRYQKHLAQMKLEKDREYKELLAKKEYAEKILSLLATGNLTFETERKLLKVLDEINGKQVEKKKVDIIYHPNPEIAQLGR